MRECPKCDGEGWVRTIRNEGEAPEDATTTCPECGGTGQVGAAVVTAAVYCPRCGEYDEEWVRPYGRTRLQCDACGLVFAPGAPPLPRRPQSATAMFEAESDAAENAAHERVR